jgi:hypothetical protein
MPGCVDDRPAAVAGKGALVAKPVQLHCSRGGRARYFERPPYSLEESLGQRVAEHLHSGWRPRGRPHRHRRGQPARPVLAQVQHSHVHPRTGRAQVDPRRSSPARLPNWPLARELQLDLLHRHHGRGTGVLALQHMRGSDQVSGAD